MFSRFLGLFTIFLALFLVKHAQAQLLQDQPTQQLVLKAVEHVYAYEFAEVEVLARQIKAKYPNHPVNPMLKALQMQWQYFPVKDSPTALKTYFQLLEDCINKAKPLQKNEKTRPEATFFLMAAHGYIALVHNYNNDFLKAVNEGKKAYGYVTDGFKFTEINPEFYFSTGLYNYYVEKYPQEHPIVKPLMWFFKDGNMPKGLQQMDIAARRGTFTRTESAFFLARIYLKHEQLYNRAATYLTALAQKYPQNPIFQMRQIEALLLAERYAEAQPILEKFEHRTAPFFVLATRTFEGLIQEKSVKNDAKAAEFYQAALKIPYDDEHTKEYHAFAYAGLARIAARANNRAKAVAYYKKMENVAEYEGLIKEAKQFLK
jgi:tetratricopeptide (TPR) repeat protein